MSVAINTIADITLADTANHAIAGSGTAKWIQFVAVSVASDAVPLRVGDTNISATRGTPLIGNATDMMPPIPGNTYDLTAIYYRGASGDKISITYAS